MYRVFGGDHGSGTTFWVTSLTLEQEYTSKSHSDHKMESIFELFRKNCIDIAGAARSIKMFKTLFSPHFEKGRRFLVIC